MHGALFETPHYGQIVGVPLVQRLPTRHSPWHVIRSRWLVAGF